MICQQCGKEWSGTHPDAYIKAFRHAKRTGHYVFGKTVFYMEFNREAADPPMKYKPKNNFL
jgi:hypothetical protein